VALRPSLLAAAALSFAGALATSPGTPEPLRYDRDVRAILSDRCFRCHGPDAGKRQAELRLDVAESATALRDGKWAIVPGDPEQSELLRRVSSTDEDVRMPPPKSGRRPLSDEERDIVRRWIAEGARYEPHWSFVAPVRPPVPAVKEAAWAQNPVDRFIRAKLEAEGVAPSPEAEPETLIRRLFLDLTGLPPTPEESDAFLADLRAPDAIGDDVWSRWVEKLLGDEPYRSRYAERMATPWLDAARYADTCGIHMDAGRQMWLWRDWVLAAYRDGMPFDQFLTEQLAGDLLPNATDAQRIASGFNRNHVTTDEGGAIAEEYLVEYAVDRAATTASVFLGLTMGCARCHDHKFDPIAQEEFYRFYSFFDSIEEPGLYAQSTDANRALEPFLDVPRPEQKTELDALHAKRDAEQHALDVPEPGEDAARESYFATVLADGGVEWPETKLVSAVSTGGATLTTQGDGSVLVSGPNPDQDEHVIALHTDAKGLRLLLLEALQDPSFYDGRVGRSDNGNAVLSSITAEAVSTVDPARTTPVHLVWAWADHEQPDGDFRAVNALDARDDLGWAVDAHRVPGGRVALFVADEPFGFEGGTELRVTLRYQSPYARHVLGRVRLSAGRIGAAGLERLPVATSAWYLVGPFPAESGHAAFETAFGPELPAADGVATRIDLSKNFGAGNQYWHFDETLADDKANGALPAGVNATYVGRRVFAPTARRAEAEVGTDDGFRLFVGGAEVAGKEVDRSLTTATDPVAFDLSTGENALVLKDANSGGQAGFIWAWKHRADELSGDLVGAILPVSARPPDLAARIVRGWRTAYSPAYRLRAERIAKLDADIAAVEALVPRTMVMKELAVPRETFVLQRGRYDHPDKARPVTRGVPAALGSLPDTFPKDRLGLAQWMTSPENPLVARVAVNRLWEQVFGTGVVRTSEDFGMQGEWPSHPELLDWLAVEFRESGWSVKRMLRLLVTSRTYRQSSRARPDVRERDPDDRWLSWFPRRRLAAEQIRDQALYTSGLLVESLGGASVKPYQPDGLWNEVAMVQSNTRAYVRGSGGDLWRRSLYTYWKRACPPPTLLTLDAPTREFCTIHRAQTNTPLQALALWNDEQLVEASRVLAERTLLRTGGDGEKLAVLFRRCTGRTPDASEIARLAETLAHFRRRYASARGDAYDLVRTGTAPLADGLDVAEVAAWTLVAGAILNLDESLSRS
jgi:mono/diheme cytochrome c family protein